MKNIVRMPSSKFIRVACKKCKNDQIIFNKASSVVKCLKCGEVLADPTGGNSYIKAKKLEELS